MLNQWFRLSKSILSFAFAMVVGLILLQTSACVHDPGIVDPVDPDPIDTTGNPIDTSGPFVPCDEDLVYFQNQVLPILISNCSVPGCHDNESHEDGVVLTSYESVMQTADVRPFDLDGSDLYEVITENDEDKWMPPSPRVRLNQEQIQVIANWIQQGAQNLTCDPDPVCNTTNVSFSQTVYPIIATNCRGCHSGPSPSFGISLENYAAIKIVAQSGQLYGAIARLPNYRPMPKNRGPLPACEVAQIKSWIDAGMLEN